MRILAILGSLASLLTSIRGGDLDPNFESPTAIEGKNKRDCDLRMESGRY